MTFTWPESHHRLAESTGVWAETELGNPQRRRATAVARIANNKYIGTLSRSHSPLRAGGRHGLIVATTIWFWIAGVDAVVGQPFHTFSVLGGVVLFTVLHYALNVAYGV